MSNKKDREVAYPEVGDTVQITVGRKNGVEYVGIYEVTEAQNKYKFTAELSDLRVVKESDIPI